MTTGYHKNTCVFPKNGSAVNEMRFCVRLVNNYCNGISHLCSPGALYMHTISSLVHIAYSIRCTIQLLVQEEMEVKSTAKTIIHPRRKLKFETYFMRKTFHNRN